jgi:hypothetical protein
LIALLLFGYGVYKYRRRRYRKVDLLVVSLMAAGLLAMSVDPSIADIPARLLGMRVRWFAVIFMSNVLLFALFLHSYNKANQALREVGELVRALARAEYEKTFYEAERNGSIFVIIPAYNEESSIGGVLPQLPDEVLGYQVYPVVVVDGAKDRTEEIVRQHNHMVATHVVNRGQGDALRTGFEIALREGADIVMTMDADGQHQAKEIVKLVEPILNGEADYVMGSRFLGEYEDRGGFRHAGIVLFTALINLVSRTRITDCTNGFRAIRASGLGRLDLLENRFSAPELIIEAAKKGLRIREVPVTIARRSAGESKKPRRLGYPLGFLRAIVQTWLRS